jgi:hypothetical protein
MKRSVLALACLLFCGLTPLSGQNQERALDDALKTLAGVLADDLVSGKAAALAVTEFSNPEGGSGGSAGALGRYVAYAFPSYLSGAGKGRSGVV